MFCKPFFSPSLIAVFGLGTALGALAGNSDGPMNGFSLSFEVPGQKTVEAGLGLASGDFNRDGTPDLVVAYPRFLAVFSGSAEAFFPKLGKRALPFEEEPSLVPIDITPDLMAGGDMNGDGFDDVVIAALGESAFYVLYGNGQSFGEPVAQGVDGPITAMAVGEIHRPDGLPDLLLATAGEEPALHMYQHPNGALAGEAEVRPLPQPAHALALGRLDDDLYGDAAAACGDSLVLIQGYHRPWPTKANRGSTQLRTFPLAVRALTFGRFEQGRRLALLVQDGRVLLAHAELWTAKKPERALEHLPVIAHWPSEHAVQLLPGGFLPQKAGIPWVLDEQQGLVRPALNQDATLKVAGIPGLAALPMRLNNDGFADLVILPKADKTALSLLVGKSALFTVNSNDDTNDGVCDVTHCSLREAIDATNTNPGLDTIAFNLSNTTITPGSELPQITDSVTIDGTTQPGYTGSPIVVLDGDSAGQDARGLYVNGASGVTVRGLVIHRFDSEGLRYEDATGGLIENNYLGTDVTGTAAMPNEYGASIRGSAITLGGTIAGAGNLISGNGSINVSTFSVDDPHLIQGNIIGPDITGTVALSSSGSGLRCNAVGPTIGGTGAGAGNLISGNQEAMGWSCCYGTLIQGNIIGLDAAGDGELGNFTGISITADLMCGYGTGGHMIGGASAGAGNVISANRNGLVIETSVNELYGNLIGTDISGTQDRGNQIKAVHFQDLFHPNVVGDITPGAGNVIAYNGGDGVSSTDPVTVEGNSIFANASYGYDFDDDGRTHNAPGQPSNFPVISALAIDGSGDFQVTYHVDRNPANAQVTYPLQVVFYKADSPENGQGRTMFATDSFAESDYQNGGKSVNLGNAAGLGVQTLDFIVTMATDEGGFTSEFSNPEIIGTSIAVTLVVNTADDSSDGTCDATHCSFREAILASNFNDGIRDTIEFAIPGSGPHTINITSSLPTINDPVTIDGGSQPGYSGMPLIELAGSGGTALAVKAGDTIIRDLAVYNFATAVLLEDLGGNTVARCFLGTDAGGTVAHGNTQYGLKADLSDNNIIGPGNLISGNSIGLNLLNSSANTVFGNKVGTDVNGVASLGNQFTGIIIQNGGGHQIGTTDPGGGNLVSANNRGISIYGTDNTVEANMVGTDITGTLALGNSQAGVELFDTGNTIGGAGTAGNLISGNGDAGVVLRAMGNRVIGNKIGTDITGTLPLGNQHGVNVLHHDQIIGEPGTGNLISGNTENGIVISADNSVVQANKIGTDINGTAALPNGLDGIIFKSGTGTLIGGENNGEGNLVSGNLRDGVRIGGTFSVEAVSLQGNLIGTDASGAQALSNGANGLTIRDSANNLIGGAGSGMGNTLSGNLRGIHLIGFEASGNIVRGNKIGTSSDGLTALGNAVSGITVSEAPGNTIGGSVFGAGNTISANGTGIQLLGFDAINNLLAGNRIGTNGDGTAALGNAAFGVYLDDAGFNTIGGDGAGEGNLISGNGASGLALFNPGSQGNRIEGNTIGTDTAGTSAMGNGTSGIFLDHAPGNTIGGSTAGAGNLISGNALNGIHLSGKATVNTHIAGNLIGSDRDGSLPLGNGAHGIAIEDFASNNQVGTIAANVITANGGDGVRVTFGIGNEITANSIFDNTGAGIDLAGNGTTNNDTMDADIGANELQNFPVIVAITGGAGTVTLEGTLNSKAERTYRLDFYSNQDCDPSGHGEGATFLGSHEVTTDALGTASFTATLPLEVVVGELVSATATDSSGNTSEFSACEERLVFRDGFESGDTSAWSGTTLKTVGALEVLEEARYGGDYGLRVHAGLGRAVLQDESPNQMTRYRMRFFARFNDLTLPEGAEIELFSGWDDHGDSAFKLVVRGTASGKEIRTAAKLDDDAWVHSDPVALERGWQLLEIDFKADAGSGWLAFWLNDQKETELAALENGATTIEGVAWGIGAEIGAPASGSLELDDFESGSRTYLGPPTCLPDAALFDQVADWPNTTLLDLLDTLGSSCH